MLEPRHARLIGNPLESGHLIGLSLDSPRPESKRPTTPEGFVFLKGWVLRKDPATRVSIVVTTGALRTEIAIEDPRPDVLRAFPMTPPGSLNCGFEARLPLPPPGEPLRIAAKIDDRHHDWQEITLTPMAEFASLAAYHRALCNDDWGSIDLEQLGAQFPAGAHPLAVTLSEHQIVADKPQAVSGFEAGTLRFLSALCAHFSRPEFVQELMDQAMQNGRLEYRADSGRIFSCTSSITIGDTNFLRYTSEDDAFILVQYVYSAVGVVYPRYNLTIALSHWQVHTWVSMLNNYVFSRMRDVAGYLSARTPHTFGGFIVGNSRPFHFFYDQLATVHRLGRDARTRLPVILLEPFAFLSLEGVLPDEVVERRIPDTDTLQRDNVLNGRFSVMLGASNRDFVRQERTLACFTDILRHVTAASEARADVRACVSALRSHSPVVWIGITSQKRRWLEQETGLVEILKRLVAAYPRLAIVFDGWTSPLLPTSKDQNETLRDQEVVDRMVAQLPGDVFVHSLVGASSFDKIAVGALVDFYVANWLQGCLHVDTICRKSGIGHFNTLWRGRYETLYHRNDCRRIDDRHITDRSSGTADQVDYSIPWQPVYEALLEVIKHSSHFVPALNDEFGRTR